jgi:SEC-C motif-containing protein
MRSRYTAYATGAVDYLLATQVGQDREAIQRWAREARFTGLEVLDTVAGGPGDEHGVVEFAATWESLGQTHVHRERSTFERRRGRWIYVSGETPKTAPLRRESPRVGRNEPCP